MAIVFDGRGFAQQIEIEMRDRVERMTIKPKLVTVVDPNNPGGMKYTELKMKMAARLGIAMERIEPDMIDDCNRDPEVGGIMVQLPHPHESELVARIDSTKDVDGLKENSKFKPAVVVAVEAILEEAIKQTGKKIERLAVVGNRGAIGSRLMNVLYNKMEEVLVVGMDKKNFNEDSLKRMDVIISCTGKEGLITPALVKEGAICIDIGYPRGDFDMACVNKASFFTPVPGGVGPVTVVMLFANLLGV